MVKITRATAELWVFPLSGPTGGSGITSVDVVVADLEDDDGHTGTGFSYVLGGGGHGVAAIAQDMLARFVEGADSVPPQVLWRRLAGSLNRLGRGSGYVAMAAIDVAMWDLHARQRGVSLATAMGGVPVKVPVYGSGGFGPTQDPEKAAERALDYSARGCSAVKLRVAGLPADKTRIEAVASVLPDNVRIMADANEKCDVVQAAWLAGVLSDVNALWLEEPLPAQNIEGLSMLAGRFSVPLATGEHHQGVVELAPIMRSGAISVVQPDLAMMGGLTECLRVAQIADYHGLVVSPHFLPALFIHLAAAVPAVRWLEDFPLLEPLFDQPVEMDDHGNMTTPTGVGHGLSWAPGAREEFRVKT